MTDRPNPSDPAPGDGDPETPEKRKGWLARLTAGLARSSQKLSGGIQALFTKRRLDEATLEELEDLLVMADLGPATAAKLTADLAAHKMDRDVTETEVREHFAAHIARLLDPVAKPLDIAATGTPTVVLVVGVNGTGKTTTIGKLARHHTERGLKVMLAAGDTFRAAAIEQLGIWAERTGAAIVSKETGADAAGLAYDAIVRARQDGADLLLIDTAGRLHNRKELMAELEKVVRVIRKLEPTAPHHVLLVLDATTGQNARSQVEVFKEMVNVTGLVVTKLDGSAKGGILVALADQFGLPVHAIGVGEGAEDLRPFSAESYARSLMGLPSSDAD